MSLFLSFLSEADCLHHHELDLLTKEESTLFMLSGVIIWGLDFHFFFININIPSFPSVVSISRAIRYPELVEHSLMSFILSLTMSNHYIMFLPRIL